MRKDGPNISKVASDLILAYKQLTGQYNDIVISPRYEKTALYFPQSPIEEQIEEENQIDSPRKTVTENEDDYLKEIGELRQIVEQSIIFEQQSENEIHEHTRKVFNITTKFKQSKQSELESEPQHKSTQKESQKANNFLRQQYGKIQ